MKDGGNSNMFFLDEIVQQIATVVPQNKSILYGEDLPLNSEYSYQIIDLDSATIVDNGLDMLNLVFSTDAIPITSQPGVFAIQAELGVNSNPLLDNFDFRFLNGALTVKKLPITIQPDTICINYGEELQ